MEEKKFEFKGVDYDKKEDEELLYEFLKLYSYYISDRSYVYKTTRKAMKEKFDKIKDKVVDLAKRGSLKALSFYLNQEDKDDWDEELVEIAKKIESREGLKSPEEWEVVAGLHVYDRVYIIIDDEVDTIKKLNRAMAYEWVRFNELENEYDHGRYYDSMKDYYQLHRYSREEFQDLVGASRRKCNWLYQCLKTGTYADAIKHAQLGFYGRYMKDRDIKALWQFLELKKSPYDFYFETDELKKLTGGNYYLGDCHFFAILKKEARKKFFDKVLHKNKNEESIVDGFAFARSMNLLGESSGFVGVGKYDKKIDQGYVEIAEREKTYGGREVILGN